MCTAERNSRLPAPILKESSVMPNSEKRVFPKN
jgi:hypothetical protein